MFINSEDNEIIILIKHYALDQSKAGFLALVLDLADDPAILIVAILFYKIMLLAYRMRNGAKFGATQFAGFKILPSALFITFPVA